MRYYCSLRAMCHDPSACGLHSGPERTPSVCKWQEEPVLNGIFVCLFLLLKHRAWASLVTMELQTEPWHKVDFLKPGNSYSGLLALGQVVITRSSTHSRDMVIFKGNMPCMFLLLVSTNSGRAVAGILLDNAWLSQVWMDTGGLTREGRGGNHGYCSAYHDIQCGQGWSCPHYC